MTADITPPPLPASCLLRVSGPGLATGPGLRSVWPSLQSPVSGFVTSDVRLGCCCCCPESVCPGHNIHNIWTLLITSHTLIVSRQGGRSLCVTSQCLMSGSWPHLDNIIIVTFSLSPDAWYWLLVCFCYSILWISWRLNSTAMIQYDANHTNNCISVSKRYTEISCLKYALCEPPICLWIRHTEIIVHLFVWCQCHNKNLLSFLYLSISLII